jgi:hypothetical protein
VTIAPPVLVLHPHASLAEAAAPQRPEVHVPDPVVDFLEADVLADAHDRDVHPTGVPANAAVGTDVLDLEAIRISASGA